MSETVLDLLILRLREAASYNANAVVEPVALLWPDETSQWKPVIERVAERLPVITLGDYAPELRQGPSYWVRCVVARTVEAGLPEGVPIVYLPSVPRNELRAIEDCPPGLAPIAELQYRGLEFTQPKSKREWSIRGFLANADRGLGLTITQGAETADALLLALNQLLDERMDRLRKLVLDADFFRELVNPDPTSMLLGWLDDPTGYRKRLLEGQWAAFTQWCSAELGFHPEREGPISAARFLGERSGGWTKVWKRFTDTPGRYSGVVDRLRQAKPMELPFEASDAWPQDNEAAEDQLRARLRDFAALTADGARKEATWLDAEHAWRRGTVWADLGLAPLAFAVEQLAVLAECTAIQPVGSDLATLAADHAKRGWQADDAALRALAAAPKSADRSAVAAAVMAIYQPWLEVVATQFQTAIGPLANAGTYPAGGPASQLPGTVNLFVDGLRLDIGHRLRDRLSSGSLEVQLTTSLAALPTVTATAKPALVPTASDHLTAGAGLCPSNAITGTQASTQVLRKLMTDAEIQVLTSTDTGDPSGRAWAEVGELDHRGHDVGVRLVDYLDEDIDRIVSRIHELLDAGWATVEVVTDHGWLLVPANLEKVELPPSTAEVKKGRCARLKEGAIAAVPTVPWFWDPNIRIAIAPGAKCFEAGKMYEHGGVSPQECVVPRLTIRVGTARGAAVGPEITKITWLGLLCRIELSGVGTGVTVDLRALPSDPGTSIAEVAKETSGVGKVSLVVPDEEHQGQRGHIVLISADGQILAQREVVVGKNR